MNPEIAKHWKTSLRAFSAAKAAFEKSEDSEVKKELHMALFYGQLAIRELDCGGIDLPADIFFDYLSRIEPLGTKQAIDETIKALKEYHNLVPPGYSLPVPIDCLFLVLCVNVEEETLINGQKLSRLSKDNYYRRCQL